MEYVESDLHGYPGSSPTNLAYDKLPEGSPMRRFLVDLFATKASPSSLKKWFKNNCYDYQFLIDLTIATKGMCSKYHYWNVNIKPAKVEAYLHKDLGMDTEQQQDQKPSSPSTSK